MVTSYTRLAAKITVAAATAAAVGCSTEPVETSSPCDPNRIERDLDVADVLIAANPTVAECTGDWAVIRWDVPGDSQRIVRRVDSSWADYVLFPHNQCWGKAAADGAPTAFRPYFTDC